MKFKFLTIIFFAVAYQFIYAQGTVISFGSGYSFFNMSSAKDFLKVNLNMGDGVQLKTVSEFPPHLYYDFKFSTNLFTNFNLGVNARFNTTGGRNIYSDYSGEAGLDQILDGYNVGLLMDGRFFKSWVPDLILTLKCDYVYSTMKNRIYERLYDNSMNYDQTYNYTSSGFSIEPGISYELAFSPVIIRAETSYNINTMGIFSSDKIYNYYTINPDKVSPDWSGFRFGISLGVVL